MPVLIFHGFVRNVSVSVATILKVGPIQSHTKFTKVITSTSESVWWKFSDAQTLDSVPEFPVSFTPFDPLHIRSPSSGFSGPSSRSVTQRTVASKPLAAWNVSRFEIPTDFYSDSLDWSAKDQIAFTLNSELVYASLATHSLTFSLCPVGNTFYVKFSASGDTFALGSLIGPICLLDAECNSPISTHDISRSCVHCIGYHGTLILSEHHDGCVSVCDTRKPLKVEVIRAQSLMSYTVLFDHEVIRFATGSDDSLFSVGHSKHVRAGRRPERASGGARNLVVPAGCEQNSDWRGVALPPPEGLGYRCEECDCRDKHGIASLQRVLVARLW
jgi:hypothetical protein